MCENCYPPQRISIQPCYKRRLRLSTRARNNAECEPTGTGVMRDPVCGFPRMQALGSSWITCWREQCRPGLLSFRATVLGLATPRNEESPETHVFSARRCNPRRDRQRSTGRTGTSKAATRQPRASSGDPVRVLATPCGSRRMVRSDASAGSATW